MVKKLKLLLASLAVAFCVVPALPAVTTHAATNPFKDACTAKGSGDSAACQTNGSDPLTGTNGIITKVARIISFLTGVSAVILILVSALMYVLSDGDAGKIHNSRTTLVYACVGLIIAGMAQGIVVLVLNRL
jgi:hypothetical protein